MTNPNDKDAFQPDIPFTLETYKTFVQHYQQLVSRKNLSRPIGPPSTSQQKLLQDIYIDLPPIYRSKLPVYLLARCPICGGQVTEAIDTFSLSGVGWWLNEARGFGWFGRHPRKLARHKRYPKPSYQTTCEHGQAVLYGLHLNHIVPDDVVNTADHVFIGSDYPGLLKPFMRQDNSYAVIHTLPIGRLDDQVWQPRYLAYFITYFNQNPQAYRQSLAPQDPQKIQFRWPYAAIDYDLANWSKTGKLLWLGAEAADWPLQAHAPHPLPNSVMSQVNRRWTVRAGKFTLLPHELGGTKPANPREKRIFEQYAVQSYPANPKLKKIKISKPAWAKIIDQLSASPETPFTSATYTAFFRHQNALYEVLHGGYNRASAPNFKLGEQLLLTLPQIYNSKLPRYILARCPLCEEVVQEGVDTFSLSGVGWWLNEARGLGWFGPQHNNVLGATQPGVSYQSNCPHVQAVAYGVNLHGILPANFPLDFKMVIGSEQPGLWSTFMQQAGSYAVMHSLTVGLHGDRSGQAHYTAYFVTYFQQEPQVYQQSLAPKNDVQHPDFYWPYDSIDYNLTPYLETGQLFWLGSEAEDYPLWQKPVSDFPYHTLSGLKGRWQIWWRSLRLLPSHLRGNDLDNPLHPAFLQLKAIQDQALQAHKFVSLRKKRKLTRQK